MASVISKDDIINFENLSVVLATDCGSTTTKAILFEKKEDGWHQTSRGEAPTTVERPVADVTIGAKNAFQELEDLSGRKLLKDIPLSEKDCPILLKQNPTDKNGVDLYVSTSSAGGGLQMIVAGVVGAMTSASAERAALGAGAIVMDSISIDDGREPYQRVQKIRHLRPDIVLVAGGTDGGTKSHPLELVETILQANPRPRFGETLKLPVIYAANKDAQKEAKEILSNSFEFNAVDNIRPTLEDENLSPARDAIHELFLNHVMSHAPGYKKLMTYSPVPIMPTPAAVGEMVLSAANLHQKQILAVDIGGATTDVFSVFNSSVSKEDFKPIFNRTVSANLGMSYSVANVLIEAGTKNIKRWLPFDLSEAEIQDRLRNKMIRPTTIPQTLEDLLLEQAICREALRLAFIHHKKLAVGLKGSKQARSLADLFRDQDKTVLVNMVELDLIIGSGGVLSHAPDRKSAALMMIDAYEPTGITELAVDSIFMMPHLGVLSTINTEASVQIFERDCLVPLGTVIAPQGFLKAGKPAFEVQIGEKNKVILNGGDFKRISLDTGETLDLTIKPLCTGINLGAGTGAPVKARVKGGQAGLILDARGRSIILPENNENRIALTRKWYKEMCLEI